MELIHVEHDNKIIEVKAQKINGALWCHFDGRTWSVPLEERNQRGRGGSATADPTKILSPMPGKILKVVRTAGDKVSAGDVVVIMEAMKMEYSLATSIDTEVMKINCEVGQQVEKDQILAEFVGE